jgi:protein RecA
MDKLEQAIAEVKAKYGKLVLLAGTEKLEFKVIPSNLREFNRASAVGGVTLGRIVEIYGPPSSGKGTLAMQLAISMHEKTGKKILYFDYEQSFDRKYAEKLGFPLDHTIFAMPENANDNLLSIEDGFEIMNQLLPTEEFCCVIWDSLAASNPRGLLSSVEEKGLDGRDIALTAAALTKGLAVYGPIYRKSETTIFFINHIRTTLNLENPFMARFGDKEHTPGGNALKHHCDQRISLTPMDYIKKTVINSDGKKIQIKLAQNVRILFVKNRVGNPFGQGVLELRSGQGFSVVSDVIKKAIEAGIVIRKSTGPIYLKDDENIKALSYDGFWNLVQANPSLLKMIESKLDGNMESIDIKNIDLSVAAKEPSVQELLDSGAVVEESNESSLEKSREISLDELLSTKTNPVVEKEPEPVASIPKRRGRPPKSKS